MKSFIFATTYNNGFGKNNHLPWTIKEDLKYFKENTINKTIIMGKNTFLSIGKELPHRKNIVISREPIEGIETINDINITGDYFVIGGAETFKKYIYENVEIDYIYKTVILNNIECDTFLDINDYIKNNFELVKRSEIKHENNMFYAFLVYKNIKTIELPPIIEHYFKPQYNNVGENQYLNLVEKILCEGQLRGTRNAKTISLFGEKITFNLKRGFPLLTSKKMFIKGILEELLWFIKGETDANILKSKNVHIWDGNTTREFLDNLGLHYPEGVCGPIYGYQWRKFGEKYFNNPGYEHGFDQLAEIIHQIKFNPNSRRIFMSAWNPNQMDQMCLPPCHVSYQFYISNGNLSCQMYQRSADIFLGLPFNIASTAFLTHLLANHCNLDVGEITICIGDCHIYELHLEQIKEQLMNRGKLYELPKLNIKMKRENIEEYIYEDFEIIGYKSNQKIIASMVA